MGFADGLVPTGVAVLVSLGVAWWGYGDLYYMGPLLPAFMALYALSAWLIYLRRATHLLAGRRARGEPASGEPGHPGTSPESPMSSSSTKLVRALLWSALQLGLLSAALYHLLGIGARFVHVVGNTVGPR